MHGRTVYITHQGAILTKRGNRLLVRGRDGDILEVPFFKFDQILIFGRATITPDLMFHIFKNDIDVALLDKGGRFKGRLTPFNQDIVRARLRQYATYHDGQKRLEIARIIVASKLRNMRTILMRQQRRREIDLSGALTMLRISAEAAIRSSSIDEVMGHEGNGTRAYFESLAKVLLQDFGFSKRVRRPPTDPVNAMLSFTYTLLFGRVFTAINIAGLDPYIGYLHSPEDRRPSLVLDLMEEFRPVVADSVVVTLINNFEVSAEDFLKDPETGAVTMSQRAIAALISAFERRLDIEAIWPGDGRSYATRDMFGLQAYAFRRAILDGENETSSVGYRPYEVR